MPETSTTATLAAAPAPEPAPLDDAIADLQRRVARIESLMPVATGLPLEPIAPAPVDEDLEDEIKEAEARLAELHARRAGGTKEWPKWVDTPAGPRIAESPEHEAELQSLPPAEAAPEPAPKSVGVAVR